MCSFKVRTHFHFNFPCHAFIQHITVAPSFHYFSVSFRQAFQAYDITRIMATQHTLNLPFYLLHQAKGNYRICILFLIHRLECTVYVLGDISTIHTYLKKNSAKVPEMFHRCFRDVSDMFQRCSRDIVWKAVAIAHILKLSKPLIQSKQPFWAVTLCTSHFYTCH